ncbi:hypothetical protein HH308_17900 [Gordonia sp. TBRC 11910]|uniref:AtuA-like ferredoxin-fold domain-containing protein n=1 Tax=Gordonia asplenii TaxID=2725283 RepID=A0A848L3E0_9ACTN|nr:hypothetical protein [Gordonia asplenii]NMO03091.1 hypothetical protein [Gordonia asplenii]
MSRIQLKDLAFARSGDKGDICNIAVIAKEPRFYPLILEYLTEDAVKDFFGDMVKGEVNRYEVRTLDAMNFVLRNALGGGATRSLRADFTGKTMCQALLRIEFDVAENDLQLMH